MKKLATLFTSFLLSLGVIYAQYDDYDLSSYKTSDFKRKSLDFEAGSQGNLQSREQKSSVIPDIEVTNKYIDGAISGYFSRKINNRSLQEKLTIGAGVSANYSKDETDISSMGSSKTEEKKDSHSISLLLDREGSHYLNQGLSFIELSPRGSLGYSRSRETAHGDNIYGGRQEYRKKNVLANVAVDLGWGKGRIEDVTDARQVVYILQELQKKGALKKTLSTDEINALTAVMTNRKNKRQFDSRVKLIEEITCLDSILVANGYVNEANGAAYYTTLYDKWMYGDRFERLSGSKFSVGVTPEYSFEENNEYGTSYYTTDDVFSEFKGSVYFKYSNEKPINLKLQRSANVKLTTWLSKIRDNDDDSLGSNLKGSFGYGYYPNTRTYLRAWFGQSLDWFRYGRDNNVIYLNSSLNFDAYYYLSPQVRIFGSCGVNYYFSRMMDFNINNNNKYPSPSFNFGIQYSLF